MTLSWYLSQIGIEYILFDLPDFGAPYLLLCTVDKRHFLPKVEPEAGVSDGLCIRLRHEEAHDAACGSSTPSIFTRLSIS